MDILELSAGTGSVGKVARELGHKVISLDKDMDAHIKTDILDWNCKAYEPKTFNLIWASPPHRIASYRTVSDTAPRYLMTPR